MPFCSFDKHLFWNPGIITFLRQRFGVGRPQEGKKNRRRLYLTRRTSRWRRVLNEDAILDLLIKQGFEVVDPGTLTIRQQLEVAGTAEIIIGAFGAGMNLFLFAPADAAIIELKPIHQLPMDINVALTRHIGQHYIDLVGTPQTEPDVQPLNYDFTVPSERVHEALRSLNALRP